MMTISLCMLSLNKILDIIYIYIFISEPTNGAKYLVKGYKKIYLSENG